MSQIVPFDGDLADENVARAKLAEVEEAISERQTRRDSLDDEIERLERIRDGLLVIVGEREVESKHAREERLARQKRLRDISERAIANLQEGMAAAAASSIQNQVEQVVVISSVPLTASDVLQHLPAGTKRETVNWALAHAANNGRLKRVTQGLYAAPDYVAPQLFTGEEE